MKVIPYYFATWVPGGSYHVYNSAVYRNVLFQTNSDHYKFRDRLRDMVTKFADVYAFAFVKNHFHCHLRIHDLQRTMQRLDAAKKLTAKEKSFLSGEATFNQLIGSYFANVFKSYAQSFNLRHHRRGTLFDQTVRRIRVTGDLTSRRLIMYIHSNEMKHHMGNSYTDVDIRSSFWHYQRIGEMESWLDTQTVIKRFGSLETFFQRHERYVKKYGKNLPHFDEEKYFGYGGKVVAKAPEIEWLDDHV